MMKNNMRKTIAVILAMALTLCCSVPTFAADSAIPPANAEMDTITTPVSEAEIMSARANSYPYPSPSRALHITTSWKTIASSTTGFGCNVSITSHNKGTIGLGIAKSDIRMLDRNGNELWYESGAVLGSGVARVFICGTDVYTIQIRTQTDTGTAYAYETTEAAN